MVSNPDVNSMRCGPSAGSTCINFAPEPNLHAETQQMINVHVPATDGRKLTLTRYTEPERALRLLIDMLKLQLPAQPPPRITAGPTQPQTTM